MKKINLFIMLLLTIIMICGCGNNQDRHEETTSFADEETESIKFEAHYSVGKNLYMVRHNEDGTDDYSPVLGVVSISQDSSDFIYSTTIECNWLDEDEVIPCKIMILANGIPIKFGQKEGESVYCSEYEAINNKENLIKFYLDENFLENVNANINLEIMCIPMPENTVWDDYSIMIASGDLIHTREAYNGFSKTELKDNIKTEMKHMESVNELIGKELYEETKYTGHIRDFVLNGVDGKYYYIGDYRINNELITYFLIDGQFIENENGIYSISWDGDNEYSAYELDLPEMEKGTHSIIAITIVKKDKLYSAYRSEGTIVEKN